MALVTNFIQDIANLLGKEKNEEFRQVFKKYKTAAHPSIDEFAQDLFGVMFGDREHAVCHLEVPKYMQKKTIILRLREQVQQRHKDRYAELVTLHFQACESKLRSKNPYVSPSKQAVITNS